MSLSLNTEGRALLNGHESKPDAAGNGQAGRPTANQPAPVKRRVRRGWIGLTCLVVAGGLVLALRRHGTSQTRAAKIRSALPAVQVSPSIARKGDIGVYVNALGTVTPIYTVQVKSRVDGQLVTVNYGEGQMVKTGDLLVEIDPRPFQAQLTQAEGQLARDRALLENANVDLERYQIAYRSNAIPKQQLDTQVATVHQYEGTVKFDQGQVDNANLQLVYAHITAPISGRVGLRLVDPGNIVHATDTNPLAIITQLQPITVIFSVAEDYLPEIQQQLGQGGKLEVEALDRAQQKKLATGTLLTLDNEIDTTTGTVKLKAIFTNADNGLFPNQFVNARLLVSTEHNATLVPATAVQRNAQGAFVYVVQPNQTVAMRPVTVGPTEGNVAAVEGVKPGEVIAGDNFNRLQEGAKVAIRAPAENKKLAADGQTHAAAGGADNP
jgi:multidrug efflux system membrane fusion protein